MVFLIALTLQRRLLLARLLLARALLIKWLSQYKLPLTSWTQIREGGDDICKNRNILLVSQTVNK
jgi:hypothetical protein